jgi:molecular chaperone DnaK (HSP70)
MLARREEVLLIAEAQGKRKAIPFTRQMLRNVGKPFDDRLLNCCRRMKEQLQEKGEKLDRLLLVGGSSRLFHVSQMVKEVFSLEPARDTDPDFVVAKGAAIWATICFGQQDQAIVIGGHQYLPSQIKIQTVAAHAICIAARRSKDRRDEKEYNYEIVPANTPLPHGFEKHFAPVDPGQSSVVIKIVQGIPDELSENSTLLREITVPIKPSEKDENRILLQGRYTEEGLLETTVVDELLGQPVSDSFTYSAGLSEDEIQEKTKRLHEVTGGDR